ncbi:twin-arginine translocase subunit TatC [Phaeodactylibacter luteus]|uniref:Sec-independent protein translocase protein TatC n=1 Tax=Phaeodactylibacter luteus TaxID=1564516 RepID=A0A5C6RYU7_9BACT|nr:twin-arginine translocase subunit TatC [Phaeodactylibacter luteus]TXB67568.1 twin-arginine translocase subunit TatC [Phaeodactylibacter luteus]
MPLDQIDVDRLGPEPQEQEMTFLEHLEELRWHIIRSLIAVVGLGIVLFLFQGWLFDTVIFGPTKADFFSYRFICNLSNSMGLGDVMCFTPPDFPKIATGFGEPFIMAIKVCFVMGLIIAFPYVLWEFWTFIKPGLYAKERRAARGMVGICSGLFIMGVLFGYYIISPFAVNFLAGYEIPGVQNTPTMSSFINYMIMFTAPAGLIFELPIIVYFLSKVGLVTPEGMKKYRRHSIIGVLVLAAMITPPDVVTQFLIGIPLYVLYEVSILVSARVNRENEEF